MAFHEPFDSHSTLYEATYVCQYVQMIRTSWALLLLARVASEAVGRELESNVGPGNTTRYAIGDARKVKIAVSNFTANDVKHTLRRHVPVRDSTHIRRTGWNLRYRTRGSRDCCQQC